MKNVDLLFEKYLKEDGGVGGAGGGGMSMGGAPTNNIGSGSIALTVDPKRKKKLKKFYTVTGDIMATSNSKEISDMQTQLSLIQKDVDNISKYFDKLDNTVEKIGELLSSMHRMVTLHEERIGVQAMDDKELRQLIESRRIETERGFEQIEKKIDGAVERFTKKLDESNKLLWKLDAKRGTIVGGIVVLAFIAGPYLSAMFQSYFKIQH